MKDRGLQVGNRKRKDKREDNISKSRNELIKVYDDALEKTIKEDITLYTALYQKLNAKVGNNYQKWRNYKLICENYKFLEFNLSFVAIIISLAALVEVELGMGVIVSLGIGIVLLAMMAIRMHRREKKFQYILGVLEDLNPKPEKKEK